MKKLTKKEILGLLPRFAIIYGGKEADAQVESALRELLTRRAKSKRGGG